MSFSTSPDVKLLKNYPTITENGTKIIDPLIQETLELLDQQNLNVYETENSSPTHWETINAIALHVLPAHEVAITASMQAVIDCESSRRQVVLLESSRYALLGLNNRQARSAHLEQIVAGANDLRAQAVAIADYTGLPIGFDGEGKPHPEATRIRQDELHYQSLIATVRRFLQQGRGRLHFKGDGTEKPFVKIFPQRVHPGKVVPLLQQFEKEGRELRNVLATWLQPDQNTTIVHTPEAAVVALLQFLTNV